MNNKGCGFTNIVVTGAGGGLGFATAKRLANAGDTVFACDLFPPRAQKFRSGKIIPVRTDVTKPADVAALRSMLDRRAVTLDCVISFAGIFFIDDFLEISDERLEKIFDVNVLGPVRVNRELFPLLRSGGKFIVVTSEVAPLDPLPFNSAYSVTKTALDSYAQALRQEAGLLGAHVVTIRPGAFDTPLAEGSIPSMREFSSRSRFFCGQAERFAKLMAMFTGSPADPALLAELIFNVTREKNPRAVYALHANPALRLLSSLPKKAQCAAVKLLVRR